MRILTVAIFMLLPGLTCVRAQTAKTEVFLRPEDVGAHKYVWQVTPQHDEVVVVYREEWMGDTLLYKREDYRGTEKEGVLCALQVLYVDGSFFDYLATGSVDKPSYGALRFPGGVALVDNNYRPQGFPDSSLNPGSVTLPFISHTDPKNRKKYVFDVYVVPYAILKQHYPDLRPLEQLRTGEL